MAGERILVVDDSAATQEIAKSILEEAGYKVTVAANGMAAIYYVHNNPVDLVVLDSEMDQIDGIMTTKQLKTDAETNRVPILLLFPEDEIEARGSQSLYGANAYLVKPFSPHDLKVKVDTLIEEKNIYEKARQHLEKAADKFMEKVAEKHIQEALEKKTQLIVERTIQRIVSIIDQKAQKEVENSVTALTSEKEQELVKMTVHEVAKSMVERLAERKVTEAMETILEEQTEKAVRDQTEAFLPTILRERIKEHLERILPKEIESRVQKAASDLVPAVSNKLVTTVDSIGQRIVPKLARERLPEMVERQINTVSTTMLPKIIRDIAAKEIERILDDKLQPVIQRTARQMRIRISIIGLVILLVALAGTILSIYFQLFGTRSP